MPYKIQIKNRFGSFLTGASFKTKPSAKRVVALQKKADKQISNKGFLNREGKPIRMSNQYKVVKVK